jgi:hypothetical protein
MMGLTIDEGQCLSGSSAAVPTSLTFTPKCSDPCSERRGAAQQFAAEVRLLDHPQVSGT